MNWNNLINFTDYSKLDIALILAGTIMWIVAYAFILRNAIRKKFVEMPAPAAAANLAWEFVWAFLLVTNLGLLFQWGLRIWFIMDVFIFYYIIKYGAKQYNNPVFKKNFTWSEVAQLVIWVPVFYYFYHEGYDTLMGSTSAFIITIPMAVLFITNFANARDKTNFSMEVAISKFVGNAFMTIFVFVHHTSGFMFVKLITVAVIFTNILYIIMVYRNKKQNYA
jgi:hypothetical protein